MSRLLFEPIAKAAWDKGWEVYRDSRRGRGYTARPAWWAIFARDPGPWGFFDIGQLHRFVESCPQPIASRWSLDDAKARQAMKARKEAA
jgi:hypothetical protein